jgi:hypothetical protein
MGALDKSKLHKIDRILHPMDSFSMTMHRSKRLIIW